MGDFNKLPDIQLKTNLRVQQIVKKATRGNAILDNVYTNMTKHYREPSILPQIGSSDHRAILCSPLPGSNINTGSKISILTRVMGANEKAMFAAALVNTKWDPIYSMENTQDKYDFFQTTITSLMNTHFPPKRVQRHTSDKPWVTDRIRELVRNRQVAYMSGNMVTYRSYRNQVNRAVKTMRSRFYRSKVKQLKDSSPKGWWHHIKSLSGMGKTSNNALQGLANDLCNSNTEMLANKINDFFESICTDLPALEINNKYATRDTGTIPAKYIISVDQVELELFRVQPNKAAGPDNIPAWVLRDFCFFCLFFVFFMSSYLA